MKPITIAAFGFCAFFAGALQTAGAASIANGSFESGSFTPDSNGAMSLQPGSTAMTNWTVVNGEIAWIQSPNSFGLTAADGSFLLDLAGYHDSVPYGGVSQTISTVVGQSYRLSLELGAANQQAASVLATAGIQSVTLTYTPSGSGFSWGTVTFDFTASNTSTPISIIGTVASVGGTYIGLDNVSISDVPEPSSCLALLLGATLIFCRSRYYRKA